MCQYQYHFYGHCQHQELVLIKLCERAAPLLQRAVRQMQELKTEGANGLASDGSSSLPGVVDPLLNSVSTARPTHHNSSIQRHLLHRLNNIKSILDSIMAEVANQTACDESHELAQEASACYDDLISGGKPKSYYRSVEAQLEKLLERMRQLGEECTPHPPAATSDSGTDEVMYRGSAAARLRQIHERNEASSPLRSTPSTAIKVDDFPTLPRAESYANVVKNNMAQNVVTQEASLDAVAVQDEDQEWCLVSRSGPATKSGTLKSSHTPKTQRQTRERASIKATEKRPVERHVRKALPQAWMQMNGDPEDSRKPAAAYTLHTKTSQPTSSLSSRPTKCTPSKATKTPGYASPTKASRHRTTMTDEVDKSSSPRKVKPVAASVDHPPVPRLAASPFYASSQKKALAAHARLSTSPTASGLGLNGAFDFNQGNVLQAFSANSVRSPAAKKARLTIAIPDPPITLPRPASPSRIPVAISPATIPQETRPVPLTGSSSSSVVISETAAPLETRPLLPTGKSSSSIAISGVTASTETKPLFPTAQTPSSLSAQEPASALLLDTIKQTAKDHAVRQGESSPVPLETDDAQQAEKLHEFKLACHSRHISVASSPERDPAVLKCGRPVKVQAEPKASPSSLRATASTFVPTPTADLFVPAFTPTLAPVSTPAFKPALSPARSPTLLPAPGVPLPTTVTSMFQPVCPPVLQPAFSPILRTTLPQFLPERSSVFDGAPEWIPRDEWFSLSPDERIAIVRKRKEIGSSPSSDGFHSAALSNSTSFPFSSPELLPAMSADSCLLPASEQPLRFGRAPLPIMPSSLERKGWDIGSAAPGWRYGWRGGDGLEISFNGDGSMAEKNPNAPFNFHEANDTQKYGNGGACGRINRNKNGPTDRVQEWARHQNYPAVPCGNFEIIEAIEHVPFTPDFSDGWCHGCLPTYC